MRVLLTSHGSTGDIYPLIGLGRALREAGHHVRYATAPLYQREIEKAGLEFVLMPPEWGPEIFADFMREINRCCSSCIFIAARCPSWVKSFGAWTMNCARRTSW